MNDSLLSAIAGALALALLYALIRLALLAVRAWRSARAAEEEAADAKRERSGYASVLQEPNGKPSFIRLAGAVGFISVMLMEWLAVFGVTQSGASYDLMGFVAALLLFKVVNRKYENPPPYHVDVEADVEASAEEVRIAQAEGDEGIRHAGVREG